MRGSMAQQRYEIRAAWKISVGEGGEDRVKNVQIYEPTLQANFQIQY